MSIAIASKLKAFEYLLIQLIKWYEDVSPGKSVVTDFNKLKVIKLHFFASAVNADSNSDGLLNIFSEFYALPFGHVESDIYDSLSNLQVFKLTKNDMSINQYPSNYFDDIEMDKATIELAVDTLKSINPNLVKYEAMDLVELSHRWYSWKTTFETARSLGRFSLRIPNELIKKESKFYVLN